MNNQRNGFISITSLLVIVIVIASVGAAGWYVSQNKDKDMAVSTTQPEGKQSQSNESGFATPKKGAHFESSTPAHSVTLAAIPADVVIDFNFDLASNSSFQIKKDGKDYGLGDTKVDSDKLALRRQMDKNAPDGVYTVSYDGCWPDKTCHDGHFQFAINRSLLNTYNDMRESKAITVKMSAIKFQPKDIRISSGTTVTWLNDDEEEHYVNTDSHPAHTHVPELNSKALKRGESYSFTFTAAGSYPYHCSAHAANMIGNIVVE